MPKDCFVKKTLIVVFTIIGFIVVKPAVSAEPDTVKAMIRSASKECRAAKNCRRSDLEKAKQHLSSYKNIVQEIVAIDAQVLNAPDSETKWVLDFCESVERDVAGSEALDVLKSGLKACAAAREHLVNQSFVEAQKQASLYRELKTTAQSVSKDVLKIYNNNYEVGICDQLEADIKSEELAYQEKMKEKEIAELRRDHKKIIKGLYNSLWQCDAARKLIDDEAIHNASTVSQIQKFSATASKIQTSNMSLNNQLKKKGVSPTNEDNKKIQEIIGQINSCQSAIPEGIAKVERALNAAKSLASKPQAQSAKSSDLQLVSEVKAAYPQSAVRREIEGFVKVKFDVGQSGQVSNIKIIQAKPRGWFEDSVLQAVQSYRYRPKLVDGNPVPVAGVEKTVVFKLGKRKKSLPKF